MKRKPYPTYKPSGVEWLGDVPKHWDVKRLKYSTSINDETLPETTDPEYEILYVDIGSIDSAVGITKKEPMIFESAPSRARRIVRHGDTIISTVRTYLRAIAPIKDAEPNLIVSTGFAVVRPRTVDEAFIAFALRAPYFVETIVSWSVGVSYPAINASDISQIEIPLPSLPEQRAIAAFLDRETGRIDELLAKKERLIKLLREKRSALISQAVTKGLDPSVKLKPSGIEWLGDVPENWNIQRLKYSAHSITGFAFSSDDYIDDGVPLIRIGDILENGSVDIENAKKLPPEYLETYPFVRVKKGDILMAMTGATIGKAGCYTDNEFGLLNQRVCKFIAILMHQDFLWYILKTIQYEEYIRLTGFGGAQPNISDKQLLEFTVALPPLDKQQSIAAYLDRETAKIDALIARIEDAIAKLKEYRTALISAAVTGKIDVSEVI